MAIPDSDTGDSNPPQHRTQNRHAAGGLIGLLLAGAGAFVMGWLFASVYGLAPDSDADLIRLGLGGATLVSALCQIAILTGGWLMWRALKGGGRK